MAENEDNISGANLDTQLLNRNRKETSEEKAGSLREAKKNSQSVELKTNYLTEEPTSLRQAVVQQKKLKAKEGLKKTVKKKVSGIRKGTSAFLRAAWIHMIDSFGLTLLYIDIHIFGNKVFGDNVFCPIGEEWFDKASVSWEKGGGELGKRVVKPVATAEKIGVGGLNLGCLLIFLAIFALVALLIKVLESPVSTFFETIWPFVWDSVKQVVEKVF